MDSVHLSFGPVHVNSHVLAYSTVFHMFPRCETFQNVNIRFFSGTRGHKLAVLPHDLLFQAPNRFPSRQGKNVQNRRFRVFFKGKRANDFLCSRGIRSFSKITKNDFARQDLGKFRFPRAQHFQGEKSNTVLQRKPKWLPKAKKNSATPPFQKYRCSRWI